VRDDGVERFDVLPLLVATDGAIRALATDRRRLRPNIVIAGVEGLASARGRAGSSRSAMWSSACRICGSAAS